MPRRARRTLQTETARFRPKCDQDRAGRHDHQEGTVVAESAMPPRSARGFCNRTTTPSPARPGRSSAPVLRSSIACGSIRSRPAPKRAATG